MIKYVIPALIVFFLIGCSSNDSANKETIAILTEPASTAWLGTWERNSWQNESTLEIKTIKNDSIVFSISAVNGGNSGGVDGVALVKKNVATYLNTEDGDTCQIQFILLGDSTISVEQQKGFCYAGMGVEYSGTYKNTRFIHHTKQTLTLLDLQIFETAEQDSVFKELVGTNYDLFVNSTQLTSNPDDLDSLHATIHASGVRGMYTFMENIVMIDQANTIWAAAIHDNQVFYFTNSESYKNKLPKTIDAWRDGFKDYEVIYK